MSDVDVERARWFVSRLYRQGYGSNLFERLLGDPPEQTVNRRYIVPKSALYDQSTNVILIQKFENSWPIEVVFMDSELPVDAVICK